MARKVITVTQIQVLVVADPSPERDQLLGALERASELKLIGTAATPAQALTAVRDTQPDIVLVDEEVAGMNTLPLIEDLATRFPEVVVVVVAEEGHLDHIRQAMLAGARGFVTLPLDEEEFPRVLQQIHRLELTRQTQLVPQQPPAAIKQEANGKILTVYSPKGGVGKTTLATNLAIALRQKTEERVVVVDIHPQFGHVGLALNVHGNYSLMDLIATADRLEPDLMDGMMPQHASGVQVVLAPSEIERADAIVPHALTKVLRVLRTTFDWVVVDTWSVLTDTTLNALDEADQTLIVVTPDLSALRDVRRFLDLAQSLELRQDRFRVVLNRADSGHLDRETIEEGLKLQIFATIPDDERVVTHSLNRGIPLVLSHRRNRVTRAILRLTDQIIAQYQEEPQRGFASVIRQRFRFGGA
jgi:pilus assembly protein CpaE